MLKHVFLAGELVPESEAKVSVFDHGLLYGDGVFEGIRIYGGRVFLHDAHIARLFESAKAIHLTIPMTPGEVKEAVERTVAKNEVTDGYVRLVVTRGAGSLGLDIRKTSDPRVIVIAADIALYPPELYRTGLKLVTAGTIRNHPAALPARVKSLNYLNNILAKIEGFASGAGEVLMLNHQGHVAECTGDNLFVVKNGVLRTPPLDAGILAGLTRAAVIELAKRRGIDVREETLVRHDIYTADECFLTGSAAEVIAAVSLDGRDIGDGNPGPLTGELLKDFRALTRGEIEVELP